MSATEQRIREFAYQIWESEGRPQGQDARHWEMACKLAEAESSTSKGPAKSQTTRKAKAAALEGVTEDAPAPRVKKARTPTRATLKTTPGS